MSDALELSTSNITKKKCRRDLLEECRETKKREKNLIAFSSVTANFNQPRLEVVRFPFHLEAKDTIIVYGSTGTLASSYSRLRNIQPEP
jgi:hypothetical protein